VLGLEGGEGLDNELVTSRFVPVAEESEDVGDELACREMRGGEGAGDVCNDMRMVDSVVCSVLVRREEESSAPGRGAERASD
jgi:hypothetical protein